MASTLLPRGKRGDVWAIYAFCRHVDNVVDDAVDHELARQELGEWRRWLQSGGPPPEPVWIPQLLGDVLSHTGSDRQPYLDLIAGLESDLGMRRVGTRDELDLYCYRVASTVGLMLLPVFGDCQPEARDGAIALGHAMQLTNILRDVGEDLRLLNRIYLPADQLAAFGVTEDMLRAGVIAEGFVSLMESEIARARDLYGRGKLTVLRTPPDCRLAVATAYRVYSAILDEIERAGYDVLSRRAYVSRRRKLQLLYHAWRDARGRE